MYRSISPELISVKYLHTKSIDASASLDNDDRGNEECVNHKYKSYKIASVTTTATLKKREVVVAEDSATHSYPVNKRNKAY